MKVMRIVVAAVVVLLGECSCLLSVQASPSRFVNKRVSNDVEKQTMKFGGHLLFPSGGSKIMSGGNDLGWLYYTYIAIGMPSVSFLVALDTGSDLLWLPCDCVQCAPLSDNDENEYKPSLSTTSKSITCSHQLCESGPTCKSPKQPCPYTANYASTATSSSGSLVEDILHLVTVGVNASNTYVRAPIAIGCGRQQTGGYLQGIAPDGVLGLGLGEVSVPSLLAKSGVMRNSFSLCFGESGFGNIYFGDQGLSTQRTTPFLPINGKYIAYIIGVENFCIGTTCLDQTDVKAQFDTGTSFTLLPNGIYNALVKEFDRQINTTKSEFDGSPFEYCYSTSSGKLPETPSVTIKFSDNNTFVIHDPLYVIHDNQGGILGYCFAIESSHNEIGLIGQNFMKGYRLVFDRDNLTLGWSRSKCQPLKGEETPGSNTSSPISLPTTEQQRPPNVDAVAPAFAGRTPNSSTNNMPYSSSLPMLLPLLLLLFQQLRC